MTEKKLSVLTRIASGVIGTLGILTAAYGVIAKISVGAEFSEFIKYPFIAFACALFFYAALTGKNLMVSPKKDTNSNVT